jgi:anthranilate 1,2-dioxygenase small subunit
LRVIDPSLIAHVDTLQLKYVRALDRRNLPDWADCFGENGSYICLPRENEEQGLALAIMMDDSRERILDRVNYITKVWAGTFEDYTTRHFVQRLECSRALSGLVTAESNFMVAYTSARGRSEILVAGVYYDEVEIGARGAVFRSKRAVLDTVTTPRYLVYPV